MRIELLWLNLLLGLGAVAAQAGESDAEPKTATATAAPTAAPKPGDICKRASFREFDFWLGEWAVYGPKGNKVGENRISLTNKNCTLAEHWTNSSGGEGRSYNAYDGLTRRWYQFWSDDQGGTLSLTGGMQSGSMVLQGERPNLADGKPQKQRITWTPLSSGHVRQLWETSDDQGASWQVSFDGEYRRND